MKTRACGKALWIVLAILLLSGSWTTGDAGILGARVVAVYGPVKIERTTTKPDAWVGTFECPVDDDKAIVKIINGSDSGGHRVTSGLVVLNGQPILGPGGFKQKNEVIEVVAPLAAGSNQLAVTLVGKPGTFITVTVFADVPPPTVTLDTAPGTINLDESSTLTWTSAFAHTLTLEPDLGVVSAKYEGGINKAWGSLSGASPSSCPSMAMASSIGHDQSLHG